MHCEQIIRVACMLLAISTSFASLPCEPAKRRFTVADDIGLRYFGDPYTGQAEAVTFSPDGRYFCVDTERGLVDRNRPESTLSVYRIEDVHQFLTHPEIVRPPSPIWTLSESTYKDGPIISHIRWLADSTGVSFLVKNPRGNNQLFLAELATGRPYAVTPEDQHVTAFDIRNRDHLVYSVLSSTIREKALSKSHAVSIVGNGRSLSDLLFPEDLYLMRHGHDLSELWAVTNGERFRVEDASTGKPFPLYSEGQTVLALSPDGQSVVTALAMRTVPSQWETLYPPPYPSYPYRLRAGQQDLEAFDGEYYASEYVSIKLTSGKVKRLTDTPIGNQAGWWVAYARAGWSADGEFVVLPNAYLPRGARDSGSKRNRPCIVVADLRNGSLSCVEWLKGPTPNGHEDGWYAIDAVHFDLRSPDHVIVNYHRIDNSKGTTSYSRSANGIWTVSPANNQTRQASASIDVFVRESLNEPPVLVASDNIRKSSRVIWDPNPQLKDIDFGEASVLRFRDKDGSEWVGGLYKPPDYAPGRRYPMVIQTHGFIQSRFDPTGRFPTAFAARELAASGILVLQVPECTNLSTQEEGSCNVARYEFAVERLDANGLVDLNRVGIVGFSRTCFHVMEALTTSKLRIRAASITDGVNQGYLQYLTRVDVQDNAIARDAEAIIGARPFGEGLQQWIKRSPEFNMDKVTTPLQVVAKGRSGLIEMWEPYAMLRYLNKPVDLILLQQGSHVLTNPSERIASQGGTVDWFRFWLKDEEDSNTAKTEQYARWRGLRNLQVKSELAQR